jgi:hypothetical protein
MNSQMVGPCNVVTVAYDRLAGFCNQVEFQLGIVAYSLVPLKKGGIRLEMVNAHCEYKLTIKGDEMRLTWNDNEWKGLVSRERFWRECSFVSG